MMRRLWRLRQARKRRTRLVRALFFAGVLTEVEVFGIWGVLLSKRLKHTLSTSLLPLFPQINLDSTRYKAGF